MSSIRDYFAPDITPCVGAVVAVHEGESTHWRVNDDGDLEVDVVTHQHAVPVTAVMGALVGGAGKGVWMIPPLGTEVLVAFMEGDYEGDACVVGVLPTGQTPSGLTEGRVLVIGTEVLVHDGNGGAVPLAKKADVDAVKAFLDRQFDPAAGHTHKAIIPAQPTNLVEGTAVAGTSTCPAAAGTTVLKAK
jgi:uncharacterized protein involved in type VI secretion and phage assembly